MSMTVKPKILLIHNFYQTPGGERGAVLAQQQLSLGTFYGINDYATDVGLAPGTVTVSGEVPDTGSAWALLSFAVLGLAALRRRLS